MFNLIVAFWVADMINLPFMEMFDTTYPVNTLFWFLFFLFTSGTKTIRVLNKND